MPGPVGAQGGTPSVLEACVDKDRRGELHGYIRIVRSNEHCGRREARLQLNVADPAPSPGSGSDYEGYGAISGKVFSCLAQGGVAGSFAYVAGQSFVAITSDTGEFTLSHLPPGTYDVTLEVPNISETGIVPGVQVNAGETKDLGTTTLCFSE
jgi:hypothetical protein